MYCMSCGKKNDDDTKYCVHCGSSINPKKILKNNHVVRQNNKTKENLSDEDIQKLIKKIKNAGLSASALGYLSIVVSCILIYLYFSNKTSGYLLSSIIFSVISSIVIIILGKRIQSVDYYVKKNLIALFIFSIIYFAILISSGGSIGIIGILLIVYLFSAFSSAKKLLNDDEYKSKLEKPKYKINIVGWIVFFIMAILIVLFASVFDQGYKGATTQVNNYFSNTGEWKEFNSTIGNFKVMLPNYPSHESNDEKIPNSNLTFKADTYTAVSEGVTYMIQFTTYPDQTDVTNPENNLEGSINGMVSSTNGNRLISSNMTNYGTNKAVDYLIQNNTTYVKGKNIMVGHSLYMLVVSYETNKLDEAKYNQFIDSFQLN